MINSDETMTLQSIRLVDNKNIMCVGENSLSVIQDIKNEPWNNASIDGDGHTTPDFYSNELKIMMDVMLIDDTGYKKGKRNPEKQAESEALARLKQTGLLDLMPNLEKVFIRPDTSTIKTKNHHNYNRYIKNFERIIHQHNRQVTTTYQKNHPGFSTIFIVNDQSTLYFESASSLQNSDHQKVGNNFFGKPHYHFLDKLLIACLKDSHFDFIIWYTPVKYVNWKRNIQSQNDVPDIPEIVVINTNELEELSQLTYTQELMMSCEN